MPALLAAALACIPAGLAAQHVHAGADSATGSAYLGAHAVALGTRIAPAVGGGSLAEGYITQPTLHAGFALRGGLLSGLATISLEGLTLERGELAPGAYGEGYIDRRHPHTFLHEALLTVRPVRSASISAGRGFAPFGTDDPMARPFVRFPVNHHLGQVLERIVLMGAARHGGVIVEAGLFSGAEPEDTEDLGSLDRFGDSWSARLTLLPAAGLELQASHARVTSPEFVAGEGWDQRKYSVSMRAERDTRHGWAYALAEWKRTTEHDDGEKLFGFGSLLAEAALARGGWSGALRVERSERPEEERRSRYRTPWPHVDTHVLGISRWTTGSVRVARELEWRGVRAAPFVEASLAHVGMSAEGLFDPVEWYGDDRIGSLSIGARLGAGAHHGRMGRYGAALP